MNNKILQIFRTLSDRLFDPPHVTELVAVRCSASPRTEDSEPVQGLVIVAAKT